MDTSVVEVPQGHEFTGQTSLGDCKKWSAKYVSIGIIIADNEVILGGIKVGKFYFPGYAECSVTTPENQSISRSSSDITQWIVSQFATVDEVCAAIEKYCIRIFLIFFNLFG